MKWTVNDLRKYWGLFRHVDEELLHEIELFHVFPIFDGYVSSSLSAIFVTKNKDVYAVGRNRNGILGVLTKASSKAKASSKPEKVPRLSGLSIQAIDTGLMHAVALTEDGCVYSWGLDVDLPYGCPLPLKRPAKFEWLELDKVLQIASGSYFNLALTATNDIKYWGYYDITQMPLRRIISISNEPSIVSLSSGLFSSAAVGSSGKVYTWTGPKCESLMCSMGMSTFDVITGIEEVPLGRPLAKRDRPLKPRPITMPENDRLEKPLKVVCTMSCMYILMDTGRIYAAGHVPRFLAECYEDLISIVCPGRPADIVGSKWNDVLAIECIEGFYFTYTDAKLTDSAEKNLLNVFEDMPTPQMRLTYGHEDLDDPVYVSPRLEINKELFCSEMLSDVKILLADNEIIPAHKYVLLEYSQHFRIMYAGEWRETNAEVIDASHYNPAAYKAYINYLYNGTLEKLSSVDLLELYHLADEYLENPLKKMCLREINNLNIESSTVAELYDWALCNDFDAFAKKCLEYGAGHVQDVLQSDGFASLNSERRATFVEEIFNINTNQEEEF